MTSSIAGTKPQRQKNTKNEVRNTKHGLTFMATTAEAEFTANIETFR